MSINKVTVQNKAFKIENGPNRDFLSDAFKYAFDAHSNVSIAFTVPELIIANVRIHSIRHVDQTGYNFTFEGRCRVGVKKSSSPSEFYNFEAKYNARTRKGEITFFEQ